MHLFNDYILLGIGVVFNFFVPGYVFMEFFLHDLKKVYKTPLYFLMSVLLSTNLIYIVSLIFGYNDITVFVTYIFWLTLFILVKKAAVFSRFHINSLILSIIVFIVFVTALFPAIFYKYKNYFVMSSDNWQDTALHLSLIQSLNQGNFPPQAPYFSGKPLSYYYFTDLHTAVMLSTQNDFKPRLLIFDNAMFAFIFSLSVYSLAYYLSRNKNASIFASILAVFSGSLIYIKFIQDYMIGNHNFLEMISSGSYVLEYGGLYQMAPMTNYFLQNRPMMVGLSSVVLAFLLILKGSVKSDYKKVWMGVLIAILTWKFQMFCSLIILLFLIISLLVYKRTKILVLILLFLPVVGLFFKNYLDLLLKNFSLGAWIQDKDLSWYFVFFFANFGILAFVFIASLLTLKLRKKYLPVLITFLVIMATPFVCTFTIDRADMLKFLYVAQVFMAVFSGLLLSKISKFKLGYLLVGILILLSILTGIVDLGGSFLNRNMAYTNADLEAGLWIKDNTPKNSIFVTYPSVHSPVTDIAGRLRVLSYITWPYTHGFNDGVDNIFFRQSDIERFYRTGDASILTKYGINYVYLGPEEISNFPEAENNIKSNPLFTLIYDKEAIQIYKLI